MKPLLLAIPVMFMAATTLPAFAAHDDEDSHAADHREHRATMRTNKLMRKAFRAGEGTAPTIVRYAILTKSFTKIIPTRVTVIVIINRSVGGVMDTEAA